MRGGSRRGTSSGCVTARMVGLRPERLVPPYVSAPPKLLRSALQESSLADTWRSRASRIFGPKRSVGPRTT